jgi:hypothetical protein
MMSRASRISLLWMAGYRAISGFQAEIGMSSSHPVRRTIGRPSQTLAGPSIQSSRASSPLKGAFLVGRPIRGCPRSFLREGVQAALHFVLLIPRASILRAKRSVQGVDR